MRKIFISIVILIVILVAILPISYAMEMKNKSFFEVNSKEISSGDTLELIINLENVDYEKFYFTISSDINIEEIYNNDEEVEIETAEEYLKIEINKNEINIKQIKLYYEIPEDVEVGNMITFKAIVYNMENNEESIEKTISVKIIENEKEKEEKQEDFDKDKQNQEQTDNADKQKNNGQAQQNLKTESSSKSSTSTKGSLSNSGNTETVTYNGSDNNYLSELSAQGYELNKTFNKESSTYFVTVDKDVSEVIINAISEDSNAIVCVAGSTNLESKTNKVLITVTAENGNVRNYKIYITKNS